MIYNIYSKLFPFFQYRHRGDDVKSIYNDDYITIIFTLRNVREKLDLTQGELAARLNVNQSFISKVENRERRLDVIEFLSWVDALGVSITDILPKKYYKENDK